MISVNQQIRLFAKKERLKQNELATALGTTPQTVSNIFKERYKPSIDFLQKLGVAFPALNTRWILLGEGDMFHGENLIAKEVGQLRIKLEACEDLCGILKKQIDDKERIIGLLEDDQDSTKTAS